MRVRNRDDDGFEVMYTASHQVQRSSFSALLSFVWKPRHHQAHDEMPRPPRAEFEKRGASSSHSKPTRTMQSSIAVDDHT
jgi:hypothetical protein